MTSKDGNCDFAKQDMLFYLVDNNVVLGPTRTYIQYHVLLGQILVSLKESVSTEHIPMSQDTALPSIHPLLGTVVWVCVPENRG